MKKIAITIGTISALVLALVAIAVLNQEIDSQENNSEPEIKKQEIESEADVIMPNKTSRPGCEKTDACYVPSTITITQGETVTWANKDVAFHSVTSGFYDSPTDLFDSGHLDPEEKFSVTFEEKGVYNYFCTLHPWMAGKVLVE